MKIVEIFKEAMPIIEKFSPTIAGALGGPWGLAASYIFPILAKTFGTESMDYKLMEQNIVNDPDAPNKLSALEDIHKDILNSVWKDLHSVTQAEIRVILSFN